MVEFNPIPEISLGRRTTSEVTQTDKARRVVIRRQLSATISAERFVRAQTDGKMMLCSQNDSKSCRPIGLTLQSGNEGDYIEILVHGVAIITTDLGSLADDAVVFLLDDGQFGAFDSTLNYAVVVGQLVDSGNGLLVQISTHPITLNN